MPLKPDEFKSIMERLDAIEKRIANLEYDVMPIKKIGGTPFAPITPWQETQNCPKCGIKLEGVMGYCCPNAGCPTGMGPVTC